MAYIAGAHAASAQTYDARTDFSSTQNPNGAWTYGWSDGLTGPLHVYNDLFTKDGGLDWTDNTILQLGTPHVALYPRDVPVSYVPPHSVLMHPGPRNQFSHCVWKAPAAGFFDIHASFASLCTGGPHGYILKNGVSIGDSLLDNGRPWACSFNSVSLAAGDTIDAAVGVGSNGTFFCDETQFSLTITGNESNTPSGKTATAVQLENALRALIRDEARNAAPSGSGDVAVESYPVDASSPAWQNCGVRIRAGEHLLIEANADDKWNLGQGQTNAKGYNFVPPNAGTALFHSGAENEDWHWGALICAVGDSEAGLDNSLHQMEIGMKREFRVKNDGCLCFICNDNRELPNGGNGFDDNSGIIHVRVTVLEAGGNPSANGGQNTPSDSNDAEPPHRGAIIPDTPEPATPEASPVGRADAAAAIGRQWIRPLRTAIRDEAREALPMRRSTGESNSFPVEAVNSTWQNSGVWVKAGQHVLAQAAEGETWNIGWGPTGPNGYAYQHDPNSGTPVFHTGAANEDWRWGALICAVADTRNHASDADRQVEIGSKKGFTVDSGGYLYFICNDNPNDTGMGYRDNTGIIHVKVTVTNPPGNRGRKAEGDASPSGYATPAGSPDAPPAKPIASPVGD